MQYRVTIRDTPGSGFFGSTTVVGCGGTGGFVAEGLCRLLPNEETLLLIDHDRVEPHNLRRQNFFEGDVGKFKSQVLAERLSRQYGRKVGYCTRPYTRHLLKGSDLGGQFQTYAAQGLVIGCVDNAGARREIMESMRLGTWWLAAGNGRHSGQVLLCNALVAGDVEKAFNPEGQTVQALPVPALQAPDLLAPSAAPARPRDCAQALDEDQSPVINQAMAVLVLEFVHRLLDNSLYWMGAYIDLEAGTRQTVPAQPEAVARIFGIAPDVLTGSGRRRAVRTRVRERGLA